MKRIAILAITAGLGFPALAAPETYLIDNLHTYPKFEYSHFGYSIQQSRFERPAARSRLIAPPRRERPTSPSIPAASTPAATYSTDT